ncbi:glycosyltransferase family 4 protein [Candidatus Giovannonibacteria bacterium]|nr:glycosyltransferase family 4 protein [Candidatus Giovannonibacteria bacterium]
MKLLVVTQQVGLTDPNLGFFHRWLEKLAEGADLFVIANQAGNYKLPENVKIYSLGKERGKWRIARFLRYRFLLLRILPQVQGVFFHMCPEYVLAAWPLNFVFRRKSILWYTHREVSWELRLAARLVDRIFTASRESFRLSSKKVVISGHGIDLAHFKSQAPRASDGTLKLLAVGRVSPSKDLMFLIEAVALLRGKNIAKKIRLDVVGAPITEADFAYQKGLKELIANKGLSKTVAFLGPKLYDEMPAVYAGHDLLLHASETGSIDKVVIEAMAAGLPVLTSSEAFYDVLPEKYLLKNKRPEEFAGKIVVNQNASRDLSLRGEVIKNHNLDNLTAAIINAFQDSK